MSAEEQRVEGYVDGFRKMARDLEVALHPAKLAIDRVMNGYSVVESDAVADGSGYFNGGIGAQQFIVSPRDAFAIRNRRLRGAKLSAAWVAEVIERSSVRAMAAHDERCDAADRRAGERS